MLVGREPTTLGLRVSCLTGRSRISVSGSLCFFQSGHRRSFFLNSGAAAASPPTGRTSGSHRVQCWAEIGVSREGALQTARNSSG